jgi:hypothetical protein
MELITDINYVKLFIFSVLRFIIAVFWYSPLMFGNSFFKLNKVDKERLQQLQNSVDMNYRFFIQFLFSCLQIYIHYHVCVALQVNNCFQSLGYSILLFIGFIACTDYSNYLWDEKPKELFFLNNGLHLFSLILFSFYIFV